MTTDSTAPETCPVCGGPALPVLYGMPDVAAVEASERVELILGGCVPEGIASRCGCGAIAYVFHGASVDAFGVDDVRDYIAEVPWQFAKTMPQWPHEYTVRDWRPDLADAFFEFVALIRAEAVAGRLADASLPPRLSGDRRMGLLDDGRRRRGHRIDQSCPSQRHLAVKG